MMWTNTRLECLECDILPINQSHVNHQPAMNQFNIILLVFVSNVFAQSKYNNVHQFGPLVVGVNRDKGSNVISLPAGFSEILDKVKATLLGEEETPPPPTFFLEDDTTNFNDAFKSYKQKLEYQNSFKNDILSIMNLKRQDENQGYQQYPMKTTYQDTQHPALNNLFKIASSGNSANQVQNHFIDAVEATDKKFI